MAHRANPAHIHLADKLGAERCASAGVETIPDVQVLLDQFRSRQRAEIANLIVFGVNSIGADRDNDVSVTGEDLCNVIISFVTGDGLASSHRTGPL